MAASCLEMLLVVDVGNTQTHFGTFKGHELLEHWRFATVRESTADELGAAVVVVDFGTAITYDPVSAQGEYLGGIIAPGIEISMDALTERAAKLPKIDLGPPRQLIGKTTVDAIRSGVVYGYAGAVDAIVARLRAEMGEDTATIATGGLAGAIVPFTESIDEVDDLLTLTGLRLLHERNR